MSNADTTPSTRQGVSAQLAKAARALSDQKFKPSSQNERAFVSLSGLIELGNLIVQLGTHDAALNEYQELSGFYWSLRKTARTIRAEDKAFVLIEKLNKLTAKITTYDDFVNPTGGVLSKRKSGK